MILSDDIGYDQAIDEINKLYKLECKFIVKLLEFYSLDI